MDDTRKVLENLCTVEGVQGAFYIDGEGGLIDSATIQPMDSDIIAHICHQSVISGRKIAESLGRDVLKQSHVEFRDSNITLELIKDGSLLAVLAVAGSNLGRIRLEIRKSKKAIEAGF